MHTVPSDTVNVTPIDEIFFIDPEDAIELNPEKEMPADETALYTAAPDNGDSCCTLNDTTWD